MNKKYNSNLGNNNNNKDYIFFRTIGNEKEIKNYNKIKGNISYPVGQFINLDNRKNKIKKYITSKEKKK